jgi:hypothetical protein
MSQKLESLHCKNALFQINDQAKLLQPLENLTKVLSVSTKVRAGNPEVIQRTVGKLKACQHAIHHPLETASSIPEAKRHLQELE